MLEDRLHYRTCIVRAWREDTGTPEGTDWRLTLEVPGLGVRKGFNSFQDLTDTMRQHLMWDEVDAIDDPTVDDLDRRQPG